MAAEVLGTLAEKIVPAGCALLVVDMENDFVHPSGKTATRGKRPLDHIHAIVPHIRLLMDGARAAGAHVVHIQHTTLRNGLSDSGPWLEARRRARYSAADVCLEGTWGHEIIDELRPVPGEAVVRKYRYGAFLGTNLDLVLRSLGVRTTICCGASTNVCVEATAREAFGHDYYVVLPHEACGSWDAALHEATLRTAGYRYAEVCSVPDILEVWRG